LIERRQPNELGAIGDRGGQQPIAYAGAGKHFSLGDRRSCDAERPGHDLQASYFDRLVGFCVRAASLRLIPGDLGHLLNVALERRTSTISAGVSTSRSMVSS
jgi:hypothetical protein